MDLFSKLLSSLLIFILNYIKLHQKFIYIRWLISNKTFFMYHFQLNVNYLEKINSDSFYFIGNINFIKLLQLALNSLLNMWLFVCTIAKRSILCLLAITQPVVSGFLN